MKKKDGLQESKSYIVLGIFILAIVLIDILLFWKSHYGCGGYDEGFYLTTAHRLTKGDALLSDEWHMSQMSSVFIYPFLKIYLFITGTTEGIILSFRMIFIMVKTAFAILFYILLQKKYGIWSVFAIAIYMLFTPYNLLQICYNSMGLSFLLLSGILYITAEEIEKSKNIKILFSGITLACAVLCCPYLVVVYFAIMIKEIILYMKRREKLYSKRIFLLTAGCAIMAVLFMIFVLSRASLQEILQNIPQMMKDPEHPVQSVVVSTWNLVKSLWQFYPIMVFVSLLLLAIITIDGILSKKKKREKLFGTTVYVGILAVSYVVTTVKLATNITFTYNLVMVPLIFIAVVIEYLMLWNKKKKFLNNGLFILWLIGVGYGLLLNMSSNNTLNIFSCAATIATFATILQWKSFVDSMEKKWIIGVGIGMICVQCSVLVYSVSEHAFWDQRVKELSITLEEGPLKGITTSEERADEYLAVINDLKEVKKLPEANFVYFSEKPYAYLFVDMPYATHSGWSGSFATQQKMDDEYYKLHADKEPEYIYIEKQYITQNDIEEFIQNSGMQFVELENGFLFQ